MLLQSRGEYKIKKMLKLTKIKENTQTWKPDENWKLLLLYCK